MTQNNCEHEEFSADVDVNRLKRSATGPITGYLADIRVRCARCGERFVWLGVPCGLSLTAPMSNMDGLELRAPLRPLSAPRDFGLDNPGFAVKVLVPEDDRT